MSEKDGMTSITVRIVGLFFGSFFIGVGVLVYFVIGPSYMPDFLKETLTGVVPQVMTEPRDMKTVPAVILSLLSLLCVVMGGREAGKALFKSDYSREFDDFFGST